MDDAVRASDFDSFYLTDDNTKNKTSLIFTEYVFSNATE